MTKLSEESIRKAQEILTTWDYRSPFNCIGMRDIIAEALDAAEARGIEDSAEKQKIAYKKGNDAGYISGSNEQDFRWHERLMKDKDGYRLGYEKGRAEMKERAAKCAEQKFNGQVGAVRVAGDYIADAIRRLE